MGTEEMGPNSGKRSDAIAFRDPGSRHDHTSECFVVFKNFISSWIGHVSVCFILHSRTWKIVFLSAIAWTGCES